MLISHMLGMRFEYENAPAAESPEGLSVPD